LVKGKVTKITNFGVFVGLEDGLEGLLHISELADDKVEIPEEMVKVGDEIEVKILRVDTDERKIGLSRKRVDWDEEVTNALPPVPCVSTETSVSCSNTSNTVAPSRTGSTTSTTESVPSGNSIVTSISPRLALAVVGFATGSLPQPKATMQSKPTQPIFLRFIDTNPRS
jgi:transcriptional accessory protein Tex/SPT6